MALSVSTLTQIHSILTSERMSYKGSEVHSLIGVLAELTQELQRIRMVQDKQTLHSRVVPRPDNPLKVVEEG